jgi:diguanylate cyclase (GGDEF)-like protein
MAMRPQWRTLAKDGAILSAVLVVLIGGAWTVSEWTVERLLHNDAVSTGQTWAGYLANNVEDLEEIAGGAKPSADSQRFFDRARQVGQVFRYVVYDPDGHLRLVSDTLDVDEDEDEDLAKHNPTAARSIAGGQPLIEVEDGKPPTRPPFFAEAYVPVTAKGKTVAIVEVYVDQTQKRNDYRHTFLAATAALGLLIGLAFGIPGVAWRRGVSEKRLADEHIRFLAHHDSLTSLPNRSRMIAGIDSALADARAHGRAVAIYRIDIDRFKDINDTLGHDRGDEVIQAIAQRLRGLVPEDGAAARLGGDEFTVLRMAVGDEDDVLKLARRIADEVAHPCVIDGKEICVAASIGIAIGPRDGDDAERLMRSADLALDRSKADGRKAIRLYSPEMEVDLNQRLNLERLVRDAVAGARFELNFQPVVKMPERRLDGFEALLRLRDERGEPIPPSVFIPVAEQIGLIGAIGTWVLREACITATSWPPHLTVAVNLSPAQFAGGDLYDTVVAALAVSGLEPRRLELEITEGLLLADSDAVLGQLRRLKDIHVGIVMDDFGTGYSSLSYLWKFPFDKIKIDRAFMSALDAEDHQNAETIVRTIIDLGRSLGMIVTVEGVENDRQVDFVEQAHGDQIQGYYFGRPLPSAEIASHILNDARRSMNSESPASEPVDKAALAG